MTPQKLREKLNDDYVIEFMKEVGVWLRRQNIRNSVSSKPIKNGEVNFSRLAYKLVYTYYKFTLKFNETGLIMTLLDQSNKPIGHYTDFDKLKQTLVKFIKESEYKKRAVKPKPELKTGEYSEE